MENLYLFADFESQSKCNLKERGARNYWSDPTTDFLFLGLKSSNTPAGSYSDIEVFDNVIKKVNQIKFIKHKYIIAHNWKFEYYGFRRLIRDGLIKDKTLIKWLSDPSNYICVQSTAQRFGFGKSSLENVSYALNIKNKKAGKGKGLIDKYSIPNRKGEFNKMSNDHRLEFIDYMKYDILAEEEIFNLLPKLFEDEKEYQYYLLDQRINERGIRIDKKSVEILLKSYENKLKETKIYAEKFGFQDSGTLTISSNQGLKELLQKELKKAYPKLSKKQIETIVPDVQAPTLKKMLHYYHAETLNDIVKTRTIIQAKAPKKLNAFLNFPTDNGDDFIYYDSLDYYHTQPTGRWQGYGIQLHNLPRIATKDFKDDLAKAKKGLMTDFSGLLRGLLIPRNGHIFGVGDFSSIELIIIAWYTNCEKILDIIRRGEKVYTHFGNDLYGRKLDKEKDKAEYNLSKQGVLSSQYGTGGKRLRITFEMYEMYITEEEATHIVKTFRSSFPEIPQFWRELENSFLMALHTKKPVKFKNLEFHFTGRAMRLKLPSGRKMYYFNPQLKRDSEGRIRIFINGNKPIWGGDFAAHVVSGTARDLLCEKYLECDKKGLNPVLSIHDEIIIELEKATAKSQMKIFEKIMTTVPNWLEGLPLSAELALVNRYTKI